MLFLLTHENIFKIVQRKIQFSHDFLTASSTGEAPIPLTLSRAPDIFVCFFVANRLRNWNVSEKIFFWTASTESTRSFVLNCLFHPLHTNFITSFTLFASHLCMSLLVEHHNLRVTTSQSPNNKVYLVLQHLQANMSGLSSILRDVVFGTASHEQKEEKEKEKKVEKKVVVEKQTEIKKTAAEGKAEAVEKKEFEKKEVLVDEVKEKVILQVRVVTDLNWCLSLSLRFLTCVIYFFLVFVYSKRRQFLKKLCLLASAKRFSLSFIVSASKLKSMRSHSLCSNAKCCQPRWRRRCLQLRSEPSKGNQRKLLRF